MYNFFGKMSIHLFSHFIIWLFSFLFSLFFFFLPLSCMTSSHTLDVNLLWNIWFSDIFSLSAGYLFTLLACFLAVKKLFILMWFKLFLFYFLYSGVISQNLLTRSMSKRFSFFFFKQFYSFRSLSLVPLWVNSYE